MSEATPAKKKTTRRTAKKTAPEAAPVEEAVTPSVEAAEGEPQEPISLTIQDLNALSTIVDAACQRGAFKGVEMETVGKTFNKLQAFLAQVAEETAEGEAEAPAEAE